MVVDEHNRNLPQPGRPADSIRHKCATLHRKKITNKDPRMPPFVSRAEHIKYLIKERAEMGDEEDAAEIADSAMKCTTHYEETDDQGADDATLD